MTNTQKKNSKNFIVNILFLFTTLLLLSSCSTEPIDKLSKKINIALRDDNKIDESEWNEFIEYIIENKQDLPDLVGENDTVNSIELEKLILSIAEKRRDKQEPIIFDPIRNPDTELEKAKIKVFIENSGSMDGYVRNTTQFEAALSDLLVQIQYKYDKENLNVNFINTKIYPSEIDEVSEFIAKLDPSRAPYKVGDRSVSKLNDILGMILDSTKQNNISILISDCIYSLDKVKDTEGALEFHKSLTKGAFLQKSKEFDFSTIVLKMNSRFEGNYYDKNNGKTYLNKKSRPYYIWIIGKDNHLSLFSENINIESLEGFKNSYFLSNSTNNQQPFYTILKETNKIGKFRDADRKTTDVKSIKSIKYKDRKLQFSIAIDLNNIPVDKTYLENVENYITPSGFSIEHIERVDRNRISKRDFLTVKKTTATHIITVSTTNEYSIQDLQLRLSNKIPSWVYESNSIDDTDIIKQLDKTFGLLYLIQGVSEAYTLQNSDNTSYFKINITIKK